jgi:hypothetical protein
MSVNITWDNTSETTIHYDLEGLWTWSDFCVGLDEIFMMMHSVGHHVDIIIDIRNSTPPCEVASLRYLKHALMAPPANTGLFVLIGNITFSNLVCFAFRRIYEMGDTFFVADSMERARAILSKHRRPANAG